MKTRNKKILFWGLCIVFIFYTIAVDTTGTAADRGEPRLTAEAKKGKLLFQDYNCTACHQLYGLGGYMGPDLTNEISTKGAAYADAFLRKGTDRMPDFNLSDEERNSLIAFLTYADQTGQSPANNASVNSNGTIRLPYEK